mgnify:CR=1 FL=1|jgi:hypothetical protein
MSQRRFAVMGDNTFKILNKLVNNQKICRLLKYQVRDPFSDKYEDVDGVDLLNRQILAVPKVFDASTEKMSYIVAVFDNFVVNQFNPEFKISTVRFDVACPYDEWVLDENSLRPYLIMQEIDNMFNQAKLSGIGNLQFHRADMLTLSPQIGGFSMEYKINEFN